MSKPRLRTVSMSHIKLPDMTPHGPDVFNGPTWIMSSSLSVQRKMDVAVTYNFNLLLWSMAIAHVWAIMFKIFMPSQDIGLSLTPRN